MNKELGELLSITVYWWNGPKRELDFEGNYRDYFKKRDIRVTKLQNKPGWQFDMTLSSTRVVLEARNPDYEVCCTDAVKVFITLLGDKSTLITRRRDYRMNW